MMVDLQIIKETYAGMGDEQLVSLVKNDGTAITHEAFIILKREYTSRGLDPVLLNEIETSRLEKAKEKVISNLKREEFIINHKLWNEVFRMKAEGGRDEEILRWLNEQGVPPESAAEAITKIASYATISFKKMRKVIALSFAFIIGGLGLCVFTFTYNANPSFYIVGALLVVTSVKYFPANNKAYRRFEKIVTDLEEKN